MHSEDSTYEHLLHTISRESILQYAHFHYSSLCFLYGHHDLLTFILRLFSLHEIDTSPSFVGFVQHEMKLAPIKVTG